MDPNNDLVKIAEGMNLIEDISIILFEVDNIPDFNFPVDYVHIESIDTLTSMRFNWGDPDYHKKRFLNEMYKQQSTYKKMKNFGIDSLVTISFSGQKNAKKRLGEGLSSSWYTSFRFFLSLEDLKKFISILSNRDHIFFDNDAPWSLRRKIVFLDTFKEIKHFGTSLSLAISMVGGDRTLDMSRIEESRDVCNYLILRGLKGAQKTLDKINSIFEKDNDYKIGKARYYCSRNKFSIEDVTDEKNGHIKRGKSFSETLFLQKISDLLTEEHIFIGNQVIRKETVQYLHPSKMYLNEDKGEVDLFFETLAEVIGEEEATGRRLLYEINKFNN